MTSPTPFFSREDADILDRIRGGDEKALVTLYRSASGPVRRYVMANSGTLDDADDMLQEALVILWERVRSGRHEHTARLTTFLVGTVRNLWLRRLARARREPAGLPNDGTVPAGDPDPLEELIEAEESQRLALALRRLGEPCRTLLVLFYWEEASMDDIARRLGFANADTAKAKKYQCKKALERILVPDERIH